MGAKSLKSLREAAAGCRRCDLYKYATQTVFGEGAAHAALLFVGEQPGDSEDKAGRPFVGPAGTLLRNAMAEAGIDPAKTYITNAVKHFKFVVRGKRRIHSKPRIIEIKACRPWLEAEIERVRPKLVVALGATAAQSLLGSEFRLTKMRRRVVPSAFGPPVVATVHPSSILRAPGSDARHAELTAFIGDLRHIAGLIA
ncbi:MAG: UdgX family uracil-DNA binding protein [Candidatus Eremiobacteraeota bacterium]|nr:UdgX family uracil-DNA binding protein [Candidatus Eremiobacteraeota bacterium]